MFRDGIFESFGDFLDSVKESTTDEGKGGYVCTRCGNRNTAEVEGKIKCLKCGHVEDMPSGDKLNIPPVKEHTGEDTQTVPIRNTRESGHSSATCPYCNKWHLLGGLELGTKSVVCKGCGKVFNLGEEVENESKLSEQERKEAEQTELPDKEPPKDDAEKLNMEDWSDTDKDGKPKRKDKVEYPSKLYEPKDSEMEDNIRYERKSDPLYLCNECFKTFRANKPICKCGSEIVEKIDVPMLKYAYKVEFEENNEKNETRVEAFDEADAKKIVQEDHPNAKVLLAKKIGETKTNEEYVEKHPGKFEVVFNDGHKETLQADSKVDAKEKAMKSYGKSSVSHVIAKEEEWYRKMHKKDKPAEGGFEVVFYDGHKELIKDAESKADAIQKAKKIYTKSSGVQNVEVLESKLEEQEETVHPVKVSFTVEGYDIENDEVLDNGLVARIIQMTFEEDETLDAKLTDLMIDDKMYESKLTENEVDNLRKQKMDIEQKMLDAEKKYRDEQNRMGSEVDRLNQQIKAKEEQKND